MKNKNTTNKTKQSPDKICAFFFILTPFFIRGVARRNQVLNSYPEIAYIFSKTIIFI